MLPENHPLYLTEVFLLDLFSEAPKDQHIEIRALWNKDIHNKVPPFKGKGVLEQYMQVGALEKLFDTIMADWILQQNRTGYDMYYGVCPRKIVPKWPGSDNPKASTANEVSHAVCAWLDIDNPNWKDTLETLKPKVTYVISSGRGVHLYFKYRNVVSIQKATGDSKAMEPVYGGDNTSNADRILRMPGTRNWKDLKKELRCEIVEMNSDVFFDGVPEPDKENVPGNLEGLGWGLRQTIVAGHSAAADGYFDPEDPGDRSKVDGRCMSSLFGLGWNEEQVRAIWTNPEYGISAKVIEEGGNGENYIARTIKYAREQAEKNMMKGVVIGESLVFETTDQIKNARPLTFVVENVLPYGGMLLISGPSKAGKSLITTELLMLLSGAVDQVPDEERERRDIDFRFLRTFKVMKPGRVAYMQAEVSRGSLAYRMNVIARSMGIDWAKLPLNFSNRSIDLSDHTNVRRIIKGLNKVKADYLIVDPLARFHTLNENRSSDMARVLQAVEYIGNETGLSGTIIIHHHGKPVEGAEREGVQRIRGASVIGDWGNAHILLRKKFSEVTGRKYVTVEFELRDAEEPSPIDMSLDRDHLRFDHFSEGEEREDIVREIHSSTTDKDKAVEEIRKKTGCSKAEAERLWAKTRLEEARAKEAAKKAVEAKKEEPKNVKVPVHQKIAIEADDEDDDDDIEEPKGSPDE